MVASVDASLSIDHGDGIGMRTLRRQIRIDTDASQSAQFSDQGDSGSVVLDLDLRIIGLLFGGSSDGSATFANQIVVALDELAVDLPDATTPPADASDAVPATSAPSGG
ncbi:hypothetical protein [Tessaracoccus antarcticus]|uniref:Uncharacterized protein n=1 Tax=Tessaracoccus antarcticus TaxID=2479848 RepID=A0A3M0GIE3_9ACTN|nr:hypothetical protein [Tessaracoccus antarcticus]RMB61383.1 hypothetical protein EAX62_01620 [Tessaracoccus antarcticus]